jgi:hypothetical protein
LKCGNEEENGPNTAESLEMKYIFFSSTLCGLCYLCYDILIETFLPMQIYIDREREINLGNLK